MLIVLTVLGLIGIFAARDLAVLLRQIPRSNEDFQIWPLSEAQLRGLNGADENQDEWRPVCRRDDVSESRVLGDAAHALEHA